MYQQQTYSPQSGLQIHYYSNHKYHTRLGRGVNLEIHSHLLMKNPEEKPLAGKNPPYMLEKKRSIPVIGDRSALLPDHYFVADGAFFIILLKTTILRF